MNTTTDPTRPPAAQATGPQPDAATGFGGPGSPPAKPGTSARPRSAPPAERDHLLRWLLLSVCLVLAALPMLVELHRPGLLDPAEARAVATSAETWRRAADSDMGRGFWSPTMPQLGGEPSVTKPPGVTWLHMAFFRGLDPAQATTQDIVLRARLASVALGLMAVAAVFWSGYSIGGVKPAVLAGLVCASCPVVVYYARLGTAPMPTLGWTMLSVGAGLWAIRPLKPAARLPRQAGGWALCGVAAGMAVLTGGLVAAPPILGPLLLILLICPHRVSHLLGLVAASIILALVLTPWALFAHEQDPEAWRVWTAELIPAQWGEPAAYLKVAGWRALLMLAVVAPWSVWLLGAIFQPLSTSSSGSRQRMFLGWAWFVTLAVMLLAAPGQGTVPELLAIVPAGAVMLGQAFRQYVDLSAQGRHARLWRVLRWPHLGVLLILSVGLPGLALAGPWLQARPIDPASLAAAVPWWYWAGLASAAVALVGLSGRLALENYPGRAVACWAVWSTLMLTVAAVPVARGEAWHDPGQDQARALGAAIGGRPAYVLTGGEHAPGEPTVARLRLYTARMLPTLTPGALNEARLENGPMLVLASEAHPGPPGFTPAGHWPALEVRVWQTASTPTEPPADPSQAEAPPGATAPEPDPGD